MNLRYHQELRREVVPARLAHLPHLATRFLRSTDCDAFRCGSSHLNVGSLVAWADSRFVAIRPKEGALLRLLWANVNEVVGTTAILNVMREGKEIA